MPIIEGIMTASCHYLKNVDVRDSAGQSWKITPYKSDAINPSPSPSPASGTTTRLRAE